MSIGSSWGRSGIVKRRHLSAGFLGLSRRDAAAILYAGRAARLREGRGVRAVFESFMRLIDALDLWLTAVRWSAWSAAVTAAAAAALSVAWRVTRWNVLARRDRRRERYRAFFEGLLSDQAPPASIIDGPRRTMDGVFLGLLADALDRADATSRPRLIALCERLGYVARFRRAAWSPLWWRRARAARWLGRLGSPESVSDLIRLLDDSSYHVRCVAVGALASWRHPRILSALLKTLDHMRERTPWGALPRRHS